VREETSEQRSKRIIEKLKTKYPGKSSFDLDGRGLHFVCEVDPTPGHPEYDRAIEVIISSKPHKHFKMTQHYTILSGTLVLHVGKKVVTLRAGDKYTIKPQTVHWATSDDECHVQIYSEPGWTKEDHVVVNKI
jgi:mannose-6-phosphate isomerase-like protein (cupin superfamily)